MADHNRDRPNPAIRTGKKPIAPAAQLVEVNKNKEKSSMDRLQNDIKHGVAHPIDELEQHVNDMDDSWETDSMLADMLDGLAKEDHINGMSSFLIPELVLCLGPAS